VAADLSPKRRELAQRLGADVVIDPAVKSPYEAWITLAATEDPARMAPPTGLIGQLPLRPTVAFECVGVPGIIQQLIAGSPAGTRIVVAGLCMETDTFEPAQAILKELDIRFAIMYSPQEFAQTFSHLAAGDLDAAPLLTGTVALDGVAGTFERLRSSPSDAKILLDPSL
jgi:threonine dehydrogenase-like Zn-dependent dehydrogenase